MPFKSKSQTKAAFAGGLGPTMQAHAPMWAAETPNLRELPEHKAMKKQASRSALLKQMKGGC